MGIPTETVGQGVGKKGKSRNKKMNVPKKGRVGFGSFRHRMVWSGLRKTGQ